MAHNSLAGTLLEPWLSLLTRLDQKLSGPKKFPTDFADGFFSEVALRLEHGLLLAEVLIVFGLRRASRWNFCLDQQTSSQPSG